MADVTLTYKGNTIAEMNATGTKTLKTAGKYCEDDIGVSYVKPESGGTSDELAKQLIQTRGNALTIPNGITKIAKYAFYYANYYEIILPEGVTEIDNYAFYGCNSITSMTFPQSLTKIGNSSFNFCLFSKIIFPQNLETIGEYIFSNCKLLKTITFQGTPTSIDSNAFKNCTRLDTINVPWSEGEVSGAPWGASLIGVTINYNYTES